MSTDLNQPVTAGTTSAVDRIASLDVSDQWKQRFYAIEKAGGVHLPLLKSLSPENRKAAYKAVYGLSASGFLAFFFGPLYYIAKGMWKKGLLIFLVMFGITNALGFLLVMFGMDPERMGWILGFPTAMIFMKLAPLDFYAFKVLKDDGWKPALFSQKK